MLTRTQVTWLNKIHKAGGLMKYYNQQDNEDYIVKNSAAKPDKGMVKRMLRGGVLLPQKDGLFGDSQTFVALHPDAIADIWHAEKQERKEAAKCREKLKK